MLWALQIQISSVDVNIKEQINETTEFKSDFLWQPPEQLITTKKEESKTRIMRKQNIPLDHWIFLSVPEP